MNQQPKARQNSRFWEDPDLAPLILGLLCVAKCETELASLYPSSHSSVDLIAFVTAAESVDYSHNAKN